MPIKSVDHVLIIHPVRPPFVAGDKFSFLSSDVSLGERLGNGHFGDVYRGVLTKTNVAVAIKTCREGVDEVKKKQFLEEAEIMKPYNHPNVVRLVGICRDREPFMICKCFHYAHLHKFMHLYAIPVVLNLLLDRGV